MHRLTSLLFALACVTNLVVPLSAQDMIIPLNAVVPPLNSVVDLAHSHSQSQVYVAGPTSTLIYPEVFVVGTRPILTASPPGPIVGIAAHPSPANSSVYWAVASKGGIDVWHAPRIGRPPARLYGMALIPGSAVIGIDVDGTGTHLLVNDRRNNVISAHVLANGNFVLACAPPGVGRPWGIARRPGLTPGYIDVPVSLMGPAPFPTHLLAFDMLRCAPLDLSGMRLPAIPRQPAFIRAIARGRGPTMYLYNLVNNVVIHANVSSSFIRGDCNSDTRVNVADILFLALACVGGPIPTCLDACDVDDTGTLSCTADLMYLVNSVFGGGPPPPPPSICGHDPTGDAVWCSSHPCP